MGDIGPVRRHYEVLAEPGLDDVTQESQPRSRGDADEQPAAEPIVDAR
jgi:hypothetical protein